MGKKIKYVGKAAGVVVFIIVTVVVIGFVFSLHRLEKPQAAEKTSQPLFPAEKCDEWLQKADTSLDIYVGAYRAFMATACYMSHLVKR